MLSRLLTLAFALVLDVQVRVAFTLRFQQGALIAVGFPIRATHRPFPSDVRAIWGTDAAWLAPAVHLASLPGATVYVVTRLYKDYPKAIAL